mmetsp:Transcript_29826/g.41517  ORF Transcript_29826/g.41517 Transcript_29826/m.41517 type:complete len:103 (+) Transcript_29826:124-432(+)
MKVSSASSFRLQVGSGMHNEDDDEEEDPWKRGGGERRIEIMLCKREEGFLLLRECVYEGIRQAAAAAAAAASASARIHNLQVESHPGAVHLVHKANLLILRI